MKKFLLGLLAVLGGLSISKVVNAAADPEVTNAASNVATVIKENAVSGITTALPIVLIAGVLILVIFLVWRFARRFIGTR